MARIIQYRPCFFSGFENSTCSFNSIEELLEIPFVKNFKDVGEKFFQYSQSEYSDKPTIGFTLMAEYDNGKTWFVVGFTDDNEIIKTLPKWQK